MNARRQIAPPPALKPPAYRTSVVGRWSRHRVQYVGYQPYAEHAPVARRYRVATGLREGFEGFGPGVTGAVVFVPGRL